MTNENNADKQFRKFWEWRLINAPEFATSIGFHEYDNRLDEMSLNSYMRRHDSAKELLGEIQRNEAQEENLSADERLNFSLITSDLIQFIESTQFKPYLMPLNMLEGPQIDFPRLLTNMKNKNIEDYELILARLRLFDLQIDETIGLLEEGISQGIVMHKVSVESLPDTFNKMAEKETVTSPLFKPFLEKPAGIESGEWEKVISEAKSIIEDKVKPAYGKISNFLNDVYLPHTRPLIGASSLPNGENYYSACLKFHTTTDLTAQQVHDIGLGEVERITQCMEKIKDQVKFQGTLKDFRVHLSTDDRFTFHSADEIVTCYQNIAKKIEEKLPEYFTVLPKCPYEISPVPTEVAPTFPAAYYLAPPHDGSKPGTFWTNTYKPETRKKYEAVSLCLHEAVPGHHLQACLTMESGSIPDFRRFMEDRKYYEPPARFSMNTGYVEGWGLYSEYLGEEMGMYNDPYDMFGRLSNEMMRACRLVVDTGMHAFNWSRDKAIEYLAENTALDLHEVTQEIDRYITWPGQACGYKIGELKIKELRAKAEEKMDDKFDLPTFHHTIASLGGVPLNILEDKIDELINSKC